LEASSFKVEEIWWYPVFKFQNKNLETSFLRCWLRSQRFSWTSFPIGFWVAKL